MSGHFFDPRNPPAWLNEADDDLPPMDYSDPASILRAMGAGAPGGLPMLKMISAESARSESEHYRSEIFENWKLLQTILERHEATIQERWAKKTKQQRLKILLAAWPNMTLHHRPDFDAFRRESLAERERSTRFKDAYMWPYINQDDLSKLNTLPLLLNARGRNPPRVFAMADENASHLGLVSKALVPAFLNEHVIYFSDKDFPSHYGELITWEDSDSAFEDMTTGKGMHPGHGLTILQQQQRLYGFLVKCCKEILHDSPADRLTSDEYPIQPEPSLPGESATDFASLALMSTEAPYRKPASLNLARLKSLLSAKVAATEDHIWALREDPSYFADSLLDLKEHRPRDDQGRQRASGSCVQSPPLRSVLEPCYRQCHSERLPRTRGVERIASASHAAAGAAAEIRRQD